ncbi:hypothetical protein [Flavisolibacter tropicus]|uniref:hypothetical protein n=1 Tax=Flavisolibacter tropicus TaxID=1492898 RepID=UPI0011DFC048|nr:hypothetical protein [Flavisolibacter tropicus]
MKFEIGCPTDSAGGVFEPQRKLSEPGFGVIKGLGGRNNEQGTRNDEERRMRMFNAQFSTINVQGRRTCSTGADFVSLGSSLLGYPQPFLLYFSILFLMI